MSRCEYKINILCSGLTIDVAESGTIPYYVAQGKVFSDAFRIADNSIELSGSRSKRIVFNADTLTTANSTYYREIVKTLLHAYFTRGAFSILRIELYAKNVAYSLKATSIIQQFTENPLEGVNTKALFSSDLKKSSLAMRCLENLALALSDHDRCFIYAWRCFNVLYCELAGERRDKKALKCLRERIESNPLEFPRTTDYASTVTIADLECLSLSAMIQHETRGVKASGVKNMLDDFEDYRVNTVLYGRMECKQGLLEADELYDLTKERIKEKIGNNEIRDTDIVRILVLKHAYYLRCVYIHAEELSPRFLIETQRMKELHWITHPVMLLCADMLANL